MRRGEAAVGRGAERTYERFLTPSCDTERMRQLDRSRFAYTGSLLMEVAHLPLDQAR